MAGLSAWDMESAVHPRLWLVLAALCAVYLLYARRAQLPWWPCRVAFIAGAAGLATSLGWPLRDLGEKLLTARLTEHVVLSLVAVPLLMSAFPEGFYRSLLCTRRRIKLARRLAHPVVAAVPFNAVVVIVHLPGAVGAQFAHPWLHALCDAALGLAAILWWWPVLTPVRETATLTESLKMLYLFLESIALSIAASALTFPTQPVYARHLETPLAAVSPVADQLIAGVMASVAAATALWVAIALQFVRGQALEESDEPEVLSWEEFEQELDLWDLRA